MKLKGEEKGNYGIIRLNKWKYFGKISVFIFYKIFEVSSYIYLLYIVSYILLIFRLLIELNKYNY